MDNRTRGGPGAPRLVLVHGIGGPRDVQREQRAWLAALATAGAPPTDVTFVDYSGLFRPRESQGPVDEFDTDLVLALVREMVTELAIEATDETGATAPLALRFAHGCGWARSGDGS